MASLDSGATFWFSVALLGFKIHLNGYTPDHWMFWVSLYYMKLLFALLSFPFLLFAVPILGDVLTLAKPTGYDKSGVLCPRLSASQVARKINTEREFRHRQLAALHRSGISKSFDRTIERMRKALSSEKALH